MKTWAVVPFRHYKDRAIVQRLATWDRLVETLTTFKVYGSKSEAPLWSPTLYREGASRGSSGVRDMTCLVLDYDTGEARTEDARKTWAGWPGLLHTSWSHTEEVHKFRVVMPLHQHVSAADWPGVFAWAAEVTDGSIDPACKDPARMYYLPSIQSTGAPSYAEWWMPEEVTEGFLGQASPWAKHVREHHAQRAEAERRRAAPAMRVQYRSVTASKRAEGRALNECPHAREALGVQLGGKVQRERVGKVTCPKCSRASVWWLINPDTKKTAQCDHLNSCGWWGHLDTLNAHMGKTAR
jgi:hypothetical protein